MIKIQRQEIREKRVTKGTTKFLNVIGFHVPEFLHSVTAIFKGDFTWAHVTDSTAYVMLHKHRPPRPCQVFTLVPNAPWVS